MSGSPARVIRTKRLLLRDWRDEDRALLAALNADPEVVEHLPGPYTREESHEFADRVEAHMREHGWGLWAVEAPGLAPFIGYVGLWPATILPSEPVEIGWRLARPYWGRGYATEAAAAALRYAFETLAVDEVVSFTVPQNVRSRRVMERIGLVHDPSRDFDHPRVDAVRFPQLVRHVLYRIGRAEWERQSSPSSENAAS